MWVLTKQLSLSREKKPGDIIEFEAYPIAQEPATGHGDQLRMKLNDD